MGHKHNVFDTDPHFLIDPVTKRIKNESSQKTTLIQRDHNSERFSFEIPEIDGHDMSKCNSVEVHYNNIDAQGNQNRGVYKVTDMKWTDDRTKVVFTWLISENATQLVGRLHFLIVFECVEDGVVVYRWQTLINSDFEIAEGMDNSGEVIETYPDIVAQWEAQIFGNAANAVSNINLAEQNAIEAVRTEGAAQVENVRATAQGIAAERTQIHLNNALKASVIEGGADGEVICLDDSAEQPFVEMSVFGKSTQKKTEGHQLFDAEQIPSTTSRGVILTNNNDGSFTITGESETITGAYFGVYKEYTHEEMVSMLKAGVLTLRVEATSYPYAYAMIRKDGANLITISNANQTSHAATIKEEYLVDETYTFRIGFYGLLDANITNGVAIKPMLYQEGDGTWEEFSGGIPSPNPEYPQEINGVENPTITVKDNEENEQNLSLPYTLHGIPVTSGGNYTDADGQEWICDEVDFAKRKYIQ
ncbi:MAG: hypothetical protein IKY14_01825, partial [Erysipelotrichaceae bacterium]|nr:hypothetical protein [Erysipelotrichaceae bacterium]